MCPFKKSVLSKLVANFCTFFFKSRLLGIKGPLTRWMARAGSFRHLPQPHVPMLWNHMFRPIIICNTMPFLAKGSTHGCSDNILLCPKMIYSAAISFSRKSKSTLCRLHTVCYWHFRQTFTPSFLKLTLGDKRASHKAWNGTSRCNEFLQAFFGCNFWKGRKFSTKYRSGRWFVVNKVMSRVIPPPLDVIVTLWQKTLMLLVAKTGKRHTRHSTKHQGGGLSLLSLVLCVLLLGMTRLW